jgi:hypothetical protein
MTIGLAGVVLALTGALAACSSRAETSSSSGHRPSSGSSGSLDGARVPPSRPTLYRVIAPLLQTKGMRMPFACQTFLLSLPPAGCGGVKVRGYDFEALPGVRRGGGAWWTPPLLLVGRWNGDVLTVTRPPTRRRPPPDEPLPPAKCTGQATIRTKALARSVTRHHARFDMLQLLPCGRRIWIMVAVADQSIVTRLRHDFGDHFIVRGWLRRIS